MEIIAHRGYWRPGLSEPGKYIPNSFEAFELALKHNFGIEVDIRDYAGDLYVSHNPAGDSAFRLDKLLEFYHSNNFNFCIAFNIKADGLQPLLNEKLKKYNIGNYFTFDMSIPNTIVDLQAGIKFFLRQSEFELHPENLGILYNKCFGIWVDQFEFDEEVLKHNLDAISKHLKEGKKVCYVSPELHPWGKDVDFRMKVWAEIKNIVGKIQNPAICLCTDYPKEAEEFFNARN